MSVGPARKDKVRVGVCGETRAKDPSAVKRKRTFSLCVCTSEREGASFLRIPSVKCMCDG